MKRLEGDQLGLDLNAAGSAVLAGNEVNASVSEKINASIADTPLEMTSFVSSNNSVDSL